MYPKRCLRDLRATGNGSVTHAWVQVTFPALFTFLTWLLWISWRDDDDMRIQPLRNS